MQVTATDAIHGQHLTYGAAGLPAGLTIDATTGLISGTLRGWGTSHVVVRARDVSGATDSANFVWVVDVAFTSAPSATATIGRSFTFTVTTTGVPTHLTMTTTPPAGVSLVDRGNGTATLSGTPSDHDGTGPHRLTLRASFGTGATADVVYQAFTLTLVR